jgi:diacylglycerol kinase family enzyme
VNVVVFYNENAGSNPAPAEIRKMIERHGHHVVDLVEKDRGVERIFDRASDLIVAVGGDGTVASVAKEAGGHDIPLAVLPLGTANNIAFSLGCVAPMDVLIDHWARAAVRHADLGIARGPWDERRFVEGVGGGLVARSIAAIDAQPLDSSHEPDHRLELAIGGYLNVLAQMRPAPWSLRLDGAPLSGEFLLVEILNMKSIGPNFVVSEATDAFDGAFTVVLAREEDRDELEAYWQARMAGESTTLNLETRIAESVVLNEGTDLHVDDALFAWPEAGSVELRVEPAVLHVLIGPAPGVRAGNVRAARESSTART